MSELDPKEAERQIEKYQRELTMASSDLSRMQGQLDAEMKRLEEFGISTLEQAQVRLGKAKDELERTKDQLIKMLEEMKEKYKV